LSDFFLQQEIFFVRDIFIAVEGPLTNNVQTNMENKMDLKIIINFYTKISCTCRLVFMPTMACNCDRSDLTFHTKNIVFKAVQLIHDRVETL
jgi:hypothetical protein